MNIFRNMSDFFFKAVRGFFVLLFILILGLIIKWKVDTIYMESIKQTEVQFTIVDELVKTGSDIKNLIHGTPKDEQTKLPNVEEKLNENSIQVSIQKDTTADMVANELIDKGFITEKGDFLAEVEKMNVKDKFVPGTYEIHKDTEIKDVILKLTNTTKKVYEVEVLQGEGIEEVSKKLQDLGVIKSAKVFTEQAKILKVEDKIKPGKYTIDTPMKVVSMLEELTQVDLSNTQNQSVPQTKEEKNK